MQLAAFLSAATAIGATASADRNAVTLNQECDTSQAYARVINRCDYPVHLWSVLKGTGCPSDGMVTLDKGETYSENYDQGGTTGDVGVSIKISKTEDCKGSDIVQLEYFMQRSGEYTGNYLDVSYVDCLGGKCPTKSEGFYLVAGNQTGSVTASSANTWCPILSCDDAESCAKIAYILPDDTQTKTCATDQSMDFYMCGGEAPDGDYSSSPEPASSSEQSQYSAPSATSSAADTSAADTSSAAETSSADYKVNAAAVTNAPDVKAVDNQKTKTHVEVVYVTAYEYVNAKRHAHGHARRHQPFHA